MTARGIPPSVASPLVCVWGGGCPCLVPGPVQPVPLNPHQTWTKGTPRQDLDRTRRYPPVDKHMCKHYRSRIVYNFIYFGRTVRWRLSCWINHVAKIAFTI